MLLHPPRPTLFPYTTLFRSLHHVVLALDAHLTPRLGLGHRAGLDELVEGDDRSEEHTSELQSRGHLVCRLLLEKKNEGLLGRRVLDPIRNRLQKVNDN